MGLRTIKITNSSDYDNFNVYLLRRRRRNNCNNFKSSSAVDDSILKELVTSLHPNASVSNKMAPALTEPLSPANKLSSSTASASPRPSTNLTSTLDNNTIETIDDGSSGVVITTSITTTTTITNTTSSSPTSGDNNENNEIGGSRGITISSLENSSDLLDSPSSVTKITDNKGPSNKGSPNSLQGTKSSPLIGITVTSSVLPNNKSKGAFQLAFEKSVAKKSATAAAAAAAAVVQKTTTTSKATKATSRVTTKAKLSPTINDTNEVDGGGAGGGDSGKIANKQMGSMCDVSSTTVGVVDSSKAQNNPITAVAEPSTAAATISKNDNKTSSNPVGGLASDFEVAISAGIVRNHKSKPAAVEATAAALSSVAEDSKILPQQQHMDFSGELNINIETANSTITTTTQRQNTKEEIEKDNDSNTMTVMKELTLEGSKLMDVTVTTTTITTTSTASVDDGSKVQSPKDSPTTIQLLNNDILSTTCGTSSPKPENVVTRLLQDFNRSESCSPNRATILSVQELPPLKNDSTVATSVDDIEARLSQLDGGDIVVTNLPNSSQETDGCVTIISGMELVSVTPPRVSQQQLLQLQQQNVQTPQTATVISIPTSSLTPQSTTSSSTTGGNMQKDFLKDSGEMDQELEEVLKALKGFDSTTGGDGLCDFGALFSDVYTTLNYEEVNQPSTIPTTTTKPSPLKEIQTEISKKQHTMQRKIDFQIRRLRKLQARYMCKHTSEEISGLFEWSARIANKRKNTDDDVGERQQLSYAEEKYHPVSTTTMISVVKKIESVANTQQISLSNAANVSGIPNKKVKNQKNLPFTLMGGGLVADSGVVVQPQTAVIVVPTFDDKVTEEIGHVSGLMHAEMREVQNALDSDATASSSGGESADEMVAYNNQIQQSLSM